MLRITAVTALEDSWLRLTLNDGQVIERYVGEAIWGVVFKAVRTDPAVFAAAYIDSGAVSWPGGADLDPEVTIWGGPPPEDPSARPVHRLRLGRIAGTKPVVA
jgi:hypothetical protein